MNTTPQDEVIAQVLRRKPGPESAQPARRTRTACERVPASASKAQ